METDSDPCPGMGPCPEDAYSSRIGMGIPFCVLVLFLQLTVSHEAGVLNSRGFHLRVYNS